MDNRYLSPKEDFLRLNRGCQSSPTSLRLGGDVIPCHLTILVEEMVTNYWFHALTDKIKQMVTSVAGE